jgi:hypothetical protein
VQLLFSNIPTILRDAGLPIPQQLRDGLDRGVVRREHLLRALRRRGVVHLPQQRFDLWEERVAVVARAVVRGRELLEGAEAEVAMWTCTSVRPGRSSAGSSRSTWFVLKMRTRAWPLLDQSPSTMLRSPDRVTCRAPCTAGVGKDEQLVSDRVT